MSISFGDRSICFGGLYCPIIFLSSLCDDYMYSVLMLQHDLGTQCTHHQVLFTYCPKGSMLTNG